VISGTTTSLRPAGIGRYITAAFLLVWLGGWIVGEVFAIGMLGTMFGSMTGLFSERLPAWSSDLATSGGAAFVIIFLLIWLTFWTIGGVVALTHVARSLAGEDVIGLSDTGFEIVRRVGPFRRRSSFERSAIRRLRVRPHDKAVVADTANGMRIVTTFGGSAERDALAHWLNRHLRLPDAATGTPPATWYVRTEGETSYLSKVGPGARLIRSVIAWALTAVAGGAWYASLGQAASLGSLAALLLTLLLAIGAAMSTFGRREWIVRPGELTFHKSFALWTVERTFRNAQLEVTHETDSDNDHHYKLVVFDADDRRTVHSQFHDSGEVEDLARWLATRTGFARSC